MIMRKIDKKGFILSVIALLLFTFEIYRISSYCLTWDEALTYNDFVQPIFRGEEQGAARAILEYFLHPGGCSANNHWLNTVSIGITDRITGIQYSEYVIRFPVFCFSIIYIAAILFSYSKNVITFSEAYMLMLSYYVDEFFTLARGYAFALTLIFIGICGVKKWSITNEMKYLVGAIASFTIAEVANTIALLPVAALYFLVFVLLIKSKSIKEFLCKYWIWLSGLAVVNLLMVMYHFKAAETDGSLYYNVNGSILSILREYGGFLLPRFDRGVMFLYIIVMTVSIVRIIYGRGVKWENFIFTGAWILCLLFTYTGVKICDKGFPTGRELIPAYPLFIASLVEMVNVIGSRMKNKTRDIISVLGCLLLCFSFISQINLEGTRDWGSYAKVKEDAYYTWETQEKVDRRDERYKSEGMQFYRDKILREYGYDIFIEE